MTTYPFNFSRVDSSWKPILQQGLAEMDPAYLQDLAESPHWLPGSQKIFNAFSLPLHHTHYVLLGESPYPRAESANGYAFWDAAVKEIWSPIGLGKKVNRATSLRNIYKMLLVAEGLLDKNHISQENIAKINKQTLVQTNDEFFTHLLKQGFLLLNATLVLHAHSPQKDARAWHPFMHKVLNDLLKKQPQIKFILLGRIANTINQLINLPASQTLYAEHPYNQSFVTNTKVLAFFKPLHLLKKSSNTGQNNVKL